MFSMDRAETGVVKLILLDGENCFRLLLERLRAVSGPPSPPIPSLEVVSCFLTKLLFCFSFSLDTELGFEDW